MIKITKVTLTYIKSYSYLFFWRAKNPPQQISELEKHQLCAHNFFEKK
jgi:hypothetical protein